MRLKRDIAVDLRGSHNQVPLPLELLQQCGEWATQKAELLQQFGEREWLRCYPCTTTTTGSLNLNRSSGQLTGLNPFQHSTSVKVCWRKLRSRRSISPDRFRCWN